MDEIRQSQGNQFIVDLLGRGVVQSAGHFDKKEIDEPHPRPAELLPGCIGSDRFAELFGEPRGQLFRRVVGMVGAEAQYGVNVAAGLFLFAFLQGLPDQFQQVLPPLEEPVVFVVFFGGDQGNVEVGRSTSFLPVPIVADHVADGGFEEVAKSAASRVGAGEIARQKPHENVLGYVLGILLVADHRPDVAANDAEVAQDQGVSGVVNRDSPLAARFPQQRPASRNRVEPRRGVFGGHGL